MILVTGGTGLLGSYLIKYLLENTNSTIKILVRNEFQINKFKSSEKLEFAVGDINDIPKLEDAFINVTQVYHCAGLVSFSPFEKDKLYKVNVEGTANIVNLCIDNGVELCHVSSVAAIGKSKKNNISDEKTEWDNSAENSFYGYTKYLGELEVWRGIEEGLSATIVNPSIILGPTEWNKSSMKLFKYIKDGNKYYTGGGNNFVDVRDVVYIMHQLMETKTFSQRFIIANERIDYKILFQKIAKALNVKAPEKQVSKWMLNLLWRIEYLIAYIFNTTPLLTKETAKVSERTHEYSSNKIKETITFNFHQIDDTIHWISKNI